MRLLLFVLLHRPRYRLLPTAGAGERQELTMPQDTRELKGGGLKAPAKAVQSSP